MFSNVLESIIKYFKKQQGVRAIVLVGSAATSSHYNDIDILILVDNQSSAARSIVAFSQKMSTKFTICDDAYRFDDLDSHEISIVPKEINYISNKIKGILSGKNLERQNKVWAAGGFFPEVLINDLETGKLIWEDSSKVFSELVQLINRKKNFFFRQLIANLLEEIELKTSSLNKDNPLGIYRQALISDIQIASLRCIYAQEGRLFRGLKKYKQDIANLSFDAQQRIIALELPSDS